MKKLIISALILAMLLVLVISFVSNHSIVLSKANSISDKVAYYNYTPTPPSP